MCTFLCLLQKQKPKGYASYQRPVTRQKTMAPRELPKGHDKSVKQLLGELYGDKVYLEKLLKETGENLFM